MPRCGSQIAICDLPIRFDTYKGCSHMCRYCFVQLKYDISNIERGEDPKSLRGFIDGQRNGETEWCDWNIPIHWGGMSDPFQPVEREHRLSYDALKVFAETQYPFVVSTKGILLAEPEYLNLLKQCNCVVQVSLVSPQYDKLEKGAPTYAERLDMIRTIAPHVKRVIVRVQPYTTGMLRDVLGAVSTYKSIGVHGLTIEGMKYKRKVDGLVKVGGDFCYPASVLKRHFEWIKAECHRNGLAFYSAENRLRKMGDSLCCCGVDGLEGFKTNTFNLNHYLFDKERYIPTEKMKEPGTCMCLKAICQNTVGYSAFKKRSLHYMMGEMSRDKGCISQLLEK